MSARAAHWGHGTCSPRSAARHGDLAELGIDPDDLPDGLVVADEHGRVICFNAAAARITAIPAADALGRPLEGPCP